MHRLETPAPARDLVAVGYGHIRGEIPVAAFFDPGLAAPPTGMRAKTIGPGAGCRLYRFRRRRVITMRVGNQDMGHLLAGEPLQQCRDVLFEIGAGIDHRDLAFADDVGAGASKGKRARIARDDAADAGGDRFEPAVFERKLTAEWDIDGHSGREYTRSAALSHSRDRERGMAR